MRILWFVNHTMPNLSADLNIQKPSSGSWLVSLSTDLVNDFAVELFILSPGKDSGIYKINNITYLTIPISFLEKNFKVGDKFFTNIKNMFQK